MAQHIKDIVKTHTKQKCKAHWGKENMQNTSRSASPSDPSPAICSSCRPAPWASGWRRSSVSFWSSLFGEEYLLVGFCSFLHLSSSVWFRATLHREMWSSVVLFDFVFTVYINSLNRYLGFGCSLWRDRFSNVSPLWDQRHGCQKLEVWLTNLLSRQWSGSGSYFKFANISKLSSTKFWFRKL